jgi:hypothetical protein
VWRCFRSHDYCGKIANQFRWGNEYRATGAPVPEQRAKGHEGGNDESVLAVWIIFLYSDHGGDFEETST